MATSAPLRPPRLFVAYVVGGGGCFLSGALNPPGERHAQKSLEGYYGRTRLEGAGRPRSA